MGRIKSNTFTNRHDKIYVDSLSRPGRKHYERFRKIMSRKLGQGDGDIASERDSF